MIFFLLVATYFMKSSRCWCSKTAPQHDVATSVLHCWTSSSPLFPPNVTFVIIAIQLCDRIIRPQDLSPEIKIFELCFFVCFFVFYLQTVIWPFYVSLASFLPSSLSAHAKTRFTVNKNTFVPALGSIFTRPLAFVLGLSSSFWTKTH